MKNSEYITNRLSLLRKKGKYNSETLFAAAFGSRNYGIHTKTSDLDIKIVYIPSIDSLINYEEKSRLCKIRDTAEDEAEIIALPYYIQLVKRFDISKLEVLFAPSYIWVNPKHKKIFQDVQKIALELVLTQKKKFICSILDVMQKIDNRFINSKLRIFNYHKAYNVPRLFILLKHVLDDNKYQLEIDDEFKDSIRACKLCVKTQEEVMEKCSNIVADTKHLINYYINSDPHVLHEQLDHIVKKAILAPNINQVIDEQQDIMRRNNLKIHYQLCEFKFVCHLFIMFSSLMMFVLVSYQ